MQETTAEGKDAGTTDRTAEIEKMRQETKRMLGISGTIAEDDSIFIAENNLRDSGGNFKDYTNKKGVVMSADYIKYVFENGHILRALDLFNQEQHDESYASFRRTMEKVEESRRKIEESKKRVDSLDIEIEESKKRVDENSRRRKEMSKTRIEY